MSGNFLELAKNRKTTYEFEAKPVADNLTAKILEAGRWAPSCTNNQPWHFVIVKDKKRIKELMMTTNYGDFHSDPPLVIALVLLQERCLGKNFSCFRGNDSGVYDSFMSVAMAGLNLTLQAREMGIDSCIITPAQEPAKTILKVKKTDHVPLIIGFGYQSKKAF